MSTDIHHGLDLLQTSLLTGKLPRNLSWADIADLIGQIGEVQPHGSDEFVFDEFVFMVGMQRGFSKHPHTHDLGVDEVGRLRKFLREAGSTQAPAKSSKPRRMVVVIDCHVVHLYQERLAPGTGSSAGWR